MGTEWLELSQDIDRTIANMRVTQICAIFCNIIYLKISKYLNIDKKDMHVFRYQNYRCQDFQSYI